MNKKIIFVVLAVLVILAILIVILFKTGVFRNRGKDEVITSEDSSAYAHTRGADYLDILSLQSQGQEIRSPININLIIDNSNTYTGVKDEIYLWLSDRLDQIIVNGDTITIWSAGARAEVIYAGVISSPLEKDIVKKNIRDMTGSGNTADFSGALQAAANISSSHDFNYTLLISASPESIRDSAANYLWYSRVEEYNKWRVLIVGLNFDEKVKKAAAAYFNR